MDNRKDNTMIKKLSLIFLVLSLLLLGGCESSSDSSSNGYSDSSYQSSDDNSVSESSDTDFDEIAKDGEYSTWEDVALYLDTYDELPSNFITKKEAESLGWESKKGNLWEVAPGKSIGGDHFSNREGQLPKSDGRKYYECDIEFEGGYRAEKRLIYSNDGLMFYTEDHYKTFDEIVFE